MTRIVSSKAEFKSEIAAADRVGHRLAFVLVKEPGVFELTFKPIETFTDWSAAS
jgi:hypothetical protein